MTSSQSRYTPPSGVSLPVEIFESSYSLDIALSEIMGSRKGIKRLRKQLSAFPGDKLVRVKIGGVRCGELSGMRVDSGPRLHRALYDLARR